MSLSTKSLSRLATIPHVLTNSLDIIQNSEKCAVATDRISV